MTNSFVVIGQCNVEGYEHGFIRENEKTEQILTEDEALSLKASLDKLYSKDYHYKIAQLSFLD